MKPRAISTFIRFKKNSLTAEKVIDRKSSGEITGEYEK
jgi:hypothetical protein